MLYAEFEKQLNGDYVVFHSINILGKARTNKGYPDDKEIDFIVYHPEKGIVCIEVKSGEIWFEDNRIYQKQYHRYEDLDVQTGISYRLIH